ncbi:BrnT family toxin, partial [Acidithiobacillus sp. IBUN Pt1247-S3]|uniref:BrnT family toxin n=1 Tax=Acidithiobacillus sp. IBUN Pt1247-S3 TaxID=3166642 RepID=UPI0034E49F71
GKALSFHQQCPTLSRLTASLLPLLQAHLWIGKNWRRPPRLAATNARKHGVTFAEAKTVFYDEQAKLIDDPDHSEDEERFVILGSSSTPKLLLVCHCYRKSGNVIRIISARKATATSPAVTVSAHFVCALCAST